MKLSSLLEIVGTKEQETQHPKPRTFMPQCEKNRKGSERTSDPGKERSAGKGGKGRAGQGRQGELLLNINWNHLEGLSNPALSSIYDPRSNITRTLTQAGRHLHSCKAKTLKI